MRKNKNSVSLNLEVNEEADSYKFNYAGDPVKILVHLCTSIVLFLKKQGNLSDEQKKKLCESISNSIYKGLNTK
jgi:hypothetical protein